MISDTIKVINLDRASGCLNEAIIQHETLHSLGFFHEHNRPDRDDFVKINFDNAPESLQGKSLSKMAAGIGIHLLYRPMEKVGGWNWKLSIADTI